MRVVGDTDIHAGYYLAMDNNQQQIVLATKDGFNRYADLLISLHENSEITRFSK